MARAGWLSARGRREKGRCGAPLECLHRTHRTRTRAYRGVGSDVLMDDCAGWSGLHTYICKVWQGYQYGEMRKGKGEVGVSITIHRI